MLARFALSTLLLATSAGCARNQTLPETTATPVYRPEDILEASGSVAGRKNIDERVALLESQVRAMRVELSRVSGATQRLEARQLQTIGVTPEPRSKAARLDTLPKAKTPPAPAKAEPPKEESEEKTTAAGATPPPPAAGSVGFAVQLGAFGSIERAAAGWEEIKSRGGDLLGDLLPKREETSIAGKPIYRLKAGPLPDEASAQKRCGALKDQGIPCIVTPFSGDWPSS